MDSILSNTPLTGDIRVKFTEMAEEGLTETVQDLIRGNCGIENSNRVSNFHKKNSYG